MTTNPTNPGWRVQLAIHRAVRRDVARLSRALAEGSDAPADAVRAYWELAAAQLHHHHKFEDTTIWPLMGERLGERVEPLLARNLHEHQVMGAAMDAFDTALASSDTASAQAVLGRLTEAVHAHLSDEEADVLPLIPEAFTLEDVAFFQAEDAKINSPSAFLPWMLDDAQDDDVSFFTAHMPPPVREQLDSEWMPSWRHNVEALGLREEVEVA